MARVHNLVPLSGLPAWLLWRAYCLSQVPTLRRKMRIFVEWIRGIFFPTDITHARFSGSEALLGAARPKQSEKVVTPRDQA